MSTQLGIGVNVGLRGVVIKRVWGPIVQTTGKLSIYMNDLNTNVRMFRIKFLSQEMLHLRQLHFSLNLSIS